MDLCLLSIYIRDGGLAAAAVVIAATAAIAATAVVAPAAAAAAGQKDDYDYDPEASVISTHINIPFSAYHYFYFTHAVGVSKRGVPCSSLLYYAAPAGRVPQ